MTFSAESSGGVARDGDVPRIDDDADLAVAPRRSSDDRLAVGEPDARSAPSRGARVRRAAGSRR